MKDQNSAHHKHHENPNNTQFKKDKVLADAPERSRYSFRRGGVWILFFLLLSLVPLGIGLVSPTPDYRNFWMEFGVTAGFVALGLFAAQFIFSGRLAWVAPSFGMDNIVHFHREIGIIAFLFLLVHPVTLLLHNPAFISYFDPGVNLMRAIALVFVNFAILGIVATSLWRIKFGLSYEKWRLLHGFLALSIVFIGVVHSVQVAHYLDPLWKKILLGATMGACMYQVLHTRLVRPWLNRKHPYRVVELKEEHDDCYSLTIAPVKGPKMKFIPGQFAWITICDTPLSLQQHPFSFSSSAQADTISFTAKVSGDFTATWKDLKPGRKVFLEGPFGSFTPEPDSHVFMVVGGIGVTPAMSILRTMRDDKDPRQAILLYASSDWDDVTFKEELVEISQQLNLRVIHILEEPPKNPTEGIETEEGRIDQEMLAKYLPENHDQFMFFICGPSGLMDVTEVALHQLGVDWRRIYSERFKIV
ncbi:ferredoxin reductase family protein [Pontibacter harenae]|uniref:ferredoxin reductase family protein n=1 Tax=Pontibacter harenae TaxID=2894083 RepID=UPI001E2E2C10|nr:ferric reductase-like transmembrane domain-containing protein [Pontibacter harenae]MCC9168112.1 ferric reductase-like transmembrane domain-containing protein [Pontibacter harenae]